MGKRSVFLGLRLLTPPCPVAAAALPDNIEIQKYSSISIQIGTYVYQGDLKKAESNF